MLIRTSISSKECVQTLAIDFLAVAQRAAIASYPWIGKGDKKMQQMGPEQKRCAIK
ncbi:hypothetical protein GCM10020331_022430 [Ectobacillus funiculus]